jgi:hypothetical protein
MSESKKPSSEKPVEKPKPNTTANRPKVVMVFDHMPPELSKKR